MQTVFFKTILDTCHIWQKNLQLKLLKVYWVIRISVWLEKDAFFQFHAIQFGLSFSTFCLSSSLHHAIIPAFWLKNELFWPTNWNQIIPKCNWFRYLKIVQVTNLRKFCSGLKYCLHLFNWSTAQNREQWMVFIKSMHNLRNYGFEKIIHVTHLWSQHIDQGFFVYISISLVLSLLLLLLLYWIDLYA